MRLKKAKQLGVLAVGLSALTPFFAQAAGGAGTKFLGGDFSYNGFLRLDTAFSTDDRVQQANQFGDLANGVPIRRVVGNPALNYVQPLLPTDALIGPAGIIPLGGLAVLPPTEGVSDLQGTNDTITRYVPKKSQLLNYHLLRFEITPTLAWGDWSLITRIRAVYHPDHFGMEEFDGGDWTGLNGGFDGGGSGDWRQLPMGKCGAGADAAVADAAAVRRVRVARVTDGRAPPALRLAARQPRGGLQGLALSRRSRTTHARRQSNPLSA